MGWTPAPPTPPVEVDEGGAVPVLPALTVLLHIPGTPPGPDPEVLDPEEEAQHDEAVQQFIHEDTT